MFSWQKYSFDKGWISRLQKNCLEPDAIVVDGVVGTVRDKAP